VSGIWVEKLHKNRCPLANPFFILKMTNFQNMGKLDKKNINISMMCLIWVAKIFGRIAYTK
jgi:hypothetical protein